PSPVDEIDFEFSMWNRAPSLMGGSEPYIDILGLDQGTLPRCMAFADHARKSLRAVIKHKERGEAVGEIDDAVLWIKNRDRQCAGCIPFEKARSCADATVPDQIPRRSRNFGLQAIAHMQISVSARLN